jgi:hypothetical protein
MRYWLPVRSGDRPARLSGESCPRTATSTPPGPEPSLAGSALLFLEPVPFGTQFIDFIEYPFQERFSRDSGNLSTLQLADFTPLTVNLDAHSLDLALDLVKLHDDLARPAPFRSGGGQQSPGGQA